MQRVLGKTLNVAVPPMLGELRFVETRTNAIGLYALCAQLSEIGRAGNHPRNRNGAGVEAALCRLERFKHFRVQTARRRRGTARRVPPEPERRAAHNMLPSGLERRAF